MTYEQIEKMSKDDLVYAFKRLTEIAEDATIKLYGKTGSKLREYTLVGCWPSDVGTIELDWNTTDTIGTYTVTWSFDYFNPGS